MWPVVTDRELARVAVVTAFSERTADVCIDAAVIAISAFWTDSVGGYVADVTGSPAVGAGQRVVGTDQRIGFSHVNLVIRLVGSRAPNWRESA